ncbi:MAG: ATP-grasp domain-containing protein [Woeseiaceae bacterium]
MRRIAYLTMADMGDFVTDYHLSIAPMAALGWQVDEVPWRSDHDWNRFDAVYICTPWDYPEHSTQFLDVLQAIDASRALLINDLALVQWTLEKTYLMDVERKGCAIVPSTWYDGFESVNPAHLFAEHKARRIVIKPTVGANAKDTYVLTEAISDTQQDELRQIYDGRAFLVQPYIESIQSEGEYSLFFFNGVYSHAIQKTPKRGDFRVQEEHGANIRSVQPTDALLKTAAALFSKIEPCPTYGRGDWVLGPNGRYLLMELELIEPSLYLRTDDGAAARFARALDERFEVFTRKGTAG